MTADRVPEWVHMAEVPPPTDDEPVTRCGICGVTLGARYDHPCAGRTRWGWAPLVILALLTLAALAWRLLR